MIETIFIAFIVYYFTLVLVFDNAVGPFQSKTSEVAFRSEDNELAVRPVNFFDRVRWLFGMYKVIKDPDKKTVWIPIPERMDVWACPICLGFWVSLAVSFVWFLTDYKFNDFIVHWLAVAGMNAFLHRGFR